MIDYTNQASLKSLQINLHVIQMEANICLGLETKKTLHFHNTATWFPKCFFVMKSREMQANSSLPAFCFSEYIEFL